MANKLNTLATDMGHEAMRRYLRHEIEYAWIYYAAYVQAVCEGE